ncbi:MAG: hypothetical protein J6P90_05320 [Rikenellaceae bacterium]|nr:hypothetical protein [Rikenellaceae bacterium]
MKRLLLLLTLLLSMHNTYAQEQPVKVRRIEVEPSIGLGDGIALAIEVRNNISPRWDIGPRASMDFYGPQASIVSDYNFVRPDNDILFFGGGGVGFGHVSRDVDVDSSHGGIATGEDATRLLIMPRAGIELFQHVRLTLYANTYNFSSIHPFISLGVVFGGGRK